MRSARYENPAAAIGRPMQNQLTYLGVIRKEFAAPHAAARLPTCVFRLEKGAGRKPRVEVRIKK